MIRSMEAKDIEQVVAVHLDSFPEFFLSFLGPRFLNIFYSGICSAPEGIGFVYINSSGIPAGFIAGTSNPRGFYSSLLKKDWLKFSFASLNAIRRKPSIIKRIARAFFHPSENPVGDDVAGLLSIGVLPEHQGSGIGKILVNTFLEETVKSGCKKVFLTTDRDNNDATNVFYQNLGFSIMRQYVTPEGRNMNEYWRGLPTIVNKGDEHV